MRLLHSSLAPECQSRTLPSISDDTASVLQQAAEFSAFHRFREAAGLALNILDIVQRTRFIHPFYTSLAEAVCCTTQEVICYDLPLSKTTWDNASKLVRVLRTVNEFVLNASAESWCHKHFLTDEDIITIRKVTHELNCISSNGVSVEPKCPGKLGRLDMYGTVCDMISRMFRKKQSRDSSSGNTLQGLLSYIVGLISATLSMVYFILLLGLPSYYASRASYIGSTPEPYHYTSRQSTEIVDIDSDMFTSCTAPPTMENPTIGSWMSMCQSLVEEWKAFRVLSALTLGAGLALFQIPSVSSDLLICFSAYFTLICMLMSTIFATIEIIYFKSWRDMRIIASWFHEIQQRGHNSAWNAWVLFSLPALWTSWGALFFLVCIFLLIWRSDPAAGSAGSATLASEEEIIGFRISLTILMVLALMYLALMLFTFRRIQHECSVVASRIKDAPIQV